MTSPDTPSSRIAAHGRMPPWLPRAVFLILAMITGFLVFRWAFDHLRGLLVNLLLAFFLSLAFEPAVDRMERHGMRRGVATGLSFLAVAIAVAGFLAALGSLLVDQIVAFAHNLPGYVERLLGWVNRTFGTDLTVGEVQSRLFKDSGTLQGYAQTLADNALGISAAIVGGIFQLFTIALFTFYFSAEGPRLRRLICSVLPPARQAEVLRGWEIAIDKTGGYLYSRAVLAVISAAAHYGALLVLGIPYAIALALWVGVISQFVPTVGTYIAILLPALIALTVGFWPMVWLVAFATAYQQFENYLLHPRITASTVDIHPAVAFGAVIAGASLLGVVGALVSIPFIASAQAFLTAYIPHYDVERTLSVGGGHGRGKGRARLRDLFRSRGARSGER